MAAWIRRSCPSGSFAFPGAAHHRPPSLPPPTSARRAHRPRRLLLHLAPSAAASPEPSRGPDKGPRRRGKREAVPRSGASQGNKVAATSLGLEAAHATELRQRGSSTGRGQEQGAHAGLDGRTEGRGRAVDKTPEPTRQLVFFEDLAEQMLDGSQVINLPAAEAVQLMNFTNKNVDRLVAKIGKSKALWRRVLVLHEWLLLVGHSPDTRLCTTLMQLCSRNGEALRALTLYEWMQGGKRAGGPALSPSIYTYTEALRAALKAEEPHRAVQIWEDAVSAGIRVDDHLLRAAVEAHVSAGRPGDGMELFDRFRESVKPGVQLYNGAMRAATLAGRPEVALGLLEELRERGLKPSLQNHTSAISAAAVLGDSDLAYQLYREALQEGTKADCRMLTALVTAFGTQHRWKQAVKVVQFMLRTGIRPSIYTYTATIGALVGAGEIDRAMSMVRRMQTPRWGSVKPNAFVYSMLLTGLGRARRYEAARLLFGTLMRRAGLRDDMSWLGEEGFSDSLELSGENYEYSAEEEGQREEGAEEEEEYEEEEDDELYGEPLEPELMNTVVVGAMLGVCHRCGRWEEALRLLEMADDGEFPGVELNTVMLNTCLSALGKAGEWETARGVYGEHEELCDHVSRETMIAAFGAGGRAREAEMMMRDMLQRGEVPQDYAFCGVIAAYRLSDRPRRAFQVRTRMRALGVDPTVHIYNELLLTCERCALWDKALELSHLMRKEGVEPNNVTQDLLSTISEKGVRSVEEQQATAAAWSAAATFAGALLVTRGVL